MLGVVLVTHGRLADEFVNIVEHIMGIQEQLVTVCIAPGDDMDQRRKDILKAVDEVNTGSGVVIVTDMFGGTPSNLAISVMNNSKIEVLAGMNLPILIKLMSVRGAMPLSHAVSAAQDAGRKYINVARNLLKAS